MPRTEEGFAARCVIDCQKEFTDSQGHDGPGSIGLPSVRSRLPGWNAFRAICWIIGASMWPNCKVQSNEETLIPYSPKVEFSA
jgi:hypothetical protein